MEIYTKQQIDDAFHWFKKFKHEKFRKYQDEAIYKIVNSELSVFVLVGPTGTGKTILGTTAIKLFGNGIYLCHSKYLQSQIKEEFPEFKILFGRSNYRCIELSDESITCADCLYQEPKISCLNYNDCIYRVEKLKVANHPFRCLNYTYFLYVNNYTTDGMFADKPIIICDEADKLEHELLNFIRINISEYQMCRLNLSAPKYKTACQKGILSWKSWAQDSLNKVKSQILYLPFNATKKELESLKSFKFKLEIFLELVDETWLFEYKDKTRYGQQWSFFPTWLTPEMTDMFFRNYCGKIVLMSAKLPPLEPLSMKLGIPVDEMEYMEVPSTWDKENRPIRFIPVVSMNKDTTLEEMEEMKPVIIKILDKYKQYKGLIHTSSYKIANFVMSIGDNRLITHEPHNKIEMIEYLKQSKEPLVMVSPSMDRGVSLNDDYCRFIILTKALFPDLSDKQTNVRLFSSVAGELWYQSEAVQNIEQACGRGDRHEDDWCDIFMLDRNIERLLDKNPKLFSRHFKERIKW